jgi:folate-binding protein YgfZ
LPELFAHAGRTIPALVRDRAVEDAAARNRAAFLPLPWRSLLVVEGSGAASFLHAMLTQDIEGMAVGETRAACQVERKGHLIADLWVKREDERILIDLQSDRVGRVVENLERYLVAEDVRLETPPDRSAILLIGPEAPEIVRGLGLEGWPVRETAGPDFLLFTGDLETLVRQLSEAGAIEIGGETFNRLRIEAGRPWFGREMNETNFPMEMGLEEAISFTKGCYIGQETIARVRYRGRMKKGLFGIRVPGEPPEEGSVVEKSGKRLSSITSIAGPASAGDSLGLLVLRSEDQTPGDRVQVGERVATLEALPFREARDG